MFIETPQSARTVGDIHLGRVQKVVEGLQAAFVDIGQNSDGFLHFSDVGTTNEDYQAMLDEDVEEDEDDDEDAAVAPTTPQLPAQASQSGQRQQGRPQQRGGNDRRPQNGQNGQGAANPNVPVNPNDKRSAEDRKNDARRERRMSHTQMIASKLKPGDSILVQVIKEPISTKGSRLTSDITIAGRFMVLLPFGEGQIAISKRISDRQERKRLKLLIKSLLPKGLGAIVRTVAEEQEEDVLRTDMEQLIAKWKRIEELVKTSKPPRVIFKEDNITASVIRDYLTEDVDEVVTNSAKFHKETQTYVRWAMPEMEKKVYLYKGRLPMFESYGVTKDVESIFSRKVWLKSGGYLIIEHTEAMVVVDVNSGRYAAKREQEENSLRTDMEAAREIARQVRMRDIGGIIVVDFIDLLDEKNSRKVYETMKQEFRRDRAKSNILPMSDFGIMQITRERVRPSLMQRMGEQCPACSGTGIIQSKKTTVNQIERWLRKYALDKKRKSNALDLFVNPVVAGPLLEEKLKPEWKWFLQHLLVIKIKPDESLRNDDFRFVLPKTTTDVTQDYINLN
ncbi:MAG: Rne/Rng family ribonuclease [Rhizobacter sp.]|nr:Rne/Rng family ribonuclease [Chlorobiales bacterium]